MQNADNIITVAPRVDGCVFSAPAGTAVPTDATSALNAAFKSRGFISEDGLTQDISRTVQKLKEMGGNVAKVIKTEHTVTYKFTPMEMNEQVLADWFGADNLVKGEGGKVTDVNIDDTLPAPKPYVFEMAADDGRLVRITCPRGQVSGNISVNWRGNTYVCSGIEVEALTDGSGSKGHIYFG